MSKLLEAILDSHSRSFPDGVALLSPDGSSIPYKKLVDNIRCIGEQLAGLGYGRGDVLVLVAPGGVIFVQSLLGCIGTCVCAPLNPAFTQQEFQSYFEALGAQAVLVDASLKTHARQAAKSSKLPVIEITKEEGGYSLSSSQVVPLIRRANSLDVSTDTALLLFSSGTTAAPKLIPLTFRNLLASVQNITQSLQLNAQDCSLCVMPLFHIHGLVGSTLAPLFSGGRVVCIEEFEIGEFFRLIRRFNATWYSAVPTIHQAIVKAQDSLYEEISGHALRFIRSSSSPLPPTLMTLLEERFDVPVVEAYGMTEGSHQVASNPLPPARRKAGSVGCATGTVVSVFEEASEKTLAIGQTGEIAIRGEAVTTGYLNHTTGRQDSFINDWLLTGDLGYIDAEGYLFITGRRKEMINRGGEKVSPGEIDRALLEHPGIEQAAAFGIAHKTLGEAVAAAVVLRDDLIVSEFEIRSFLADRIADYKVPAKVWFVGQIPVTDTGKPQRHMLAKQFVGLPDGEYVKTSSEVEKSLLNIWKDVLGREDLGIHDNFFLSGGDSLIAVQVVARARSRMSIELPLRWIFESPTVGELSARIDTELNDADGEEILI